MKYYNPETYYNLELNIISCLLQRPELMTKCELEDKHFKKHQKLWKFVRIFYSKYKCLDIPLMLSVAKDRMNLIEYLSWLVELEPAPSCFEKYQKRLLEMYEESEQEKEKIEKIYNLATELTVRKINLKEFKEKILEVLE